VVVIGYLELFSISKIKTTYLFLTSVTWYQWLPYINTKFLTDTYRCIYEKHKGINKFLFKEASWEKYSFFFLKRFLLGRKVETAVWQKVESLPWTD
jgi:hypothetical protein